MSIPLGFEIGPLYIRFYGIIIMLGVVAAAYLTARLARWKGLDTELVWDGLIWVVIGGVIGARIWHILTPPPSMVERGITTMYYLTHPLDAINIRQGGLGIPGAVIGGVLALYLFSRYRKQNFLTWMDIASPALALGQAIGRWGNFINQEVYGSPTDLPWGIKIDPQFRLPEFREYERFHPLFLYESLLSFANVGILIWIMRRFEDRLHPGDVFLVYLILYPLQRFFLEFLRLDSSLVGGINANQAFMAIISVVAIAILLWRHVINPRISKAKPAV